MNNITAKRAQSALKKFADPKRAKTNAKFFKTGKGSYGEGDKFIGVSVPDTRRVAQEFYKLSFPHIKELLISKVHEERVLAALILVAKYEAGDHKKVYDFYVRNRTRMNNWDIVDVSCCQIVGDYLLDRSRRPLYKFAKEKNLWSRRISIVSTWAFIKQGDIEDTLKLSEMLLGDEQDLMHKAVGWMLREAGKVNEKRLVGFLKQNYEDIPRTALRYAIEKFPEMRRKKALKGRF